MNPVFRFFNWWIEELARVVEPLTALRRKRADYVLVQDGDRFTCLRGGRRGLKEIGVFDASTGSEGDIPRKLKGHTVELRLDPDTVLDKKLKLPAAGEQYLDAILRHQIERLTPWAADRVAFDYVIDRSEPVGDGQVSIRLVATARDTVTSTLKPLEEAGIKPSIVGTAADPLDHQSLIDLQDGGKDERQTSLRRSIALGLGAAAAVILIFGGFQTWQVFQLSSESEQVQAAIEARRNVIAAAVARTTSSDEFRELAARKQSAMPMVVLLEELSKTIPTNTYLTELNVEGATLRINGTSAEAPALIELLEDTDTLADAQFGAPTTRNEGDNGDSFQIVVRIGTPDAAPGAAPEASTE